MAGFMSSNASMTIFLFDKKCILDVEKLRKGAFTEAIDPDGYRHGWTGLGDQLDTENFFLASPEEGFSGFSWRFDSRKLSSAVIKLQLAEKLKQEEADGKKPGKARKQELKETITSVLLSQTQFSPTLTDCIWDGGNGRLFVASTSPLTLERVFKYFCSTFDMTGNLLEPDADMTEVFSAIQKDNGKNILDYFVQPLGNAHLAAMEDGEKSIVVAQNNLDAVNEALKNGMKITKMGLIATKGDEELKFNLGADLKISGIRFPKPEKGAEEEATFLINADICARISSIVQELAK